MSVNNLLFGQWGCVNIFFSLTGGSGLLLSIKLMSNQMISKLCEGITKFRNNLIQIV